jgi:hypothetical protein
VQEKALSQAEAPMAAPPGLGTGAGSSGQVVGPDGRTSSPVQYVGDKTFVLYEGVWTDTTFDPDKMEPVAVSFGSDDYFALIAAEPSWGRYFALGDHVIVVVDGTAYEVRQGDAPPVDVPTPDVEPTEGVAPEPQTADNLLEAIGQVFQDLIQTIAGFFNQ